MKRQPEPWAEDIEKAIAKAYQQGYEDASVEFGKKMTEVYELASKIMQRMAGYRPPPTSEAIQDAITTAYKATHTPKRKAVTASVQHIMAAAEVLYNTKPPYSALSPRNVAAVWPIAGAGPKLAGAALKALVADGRAVVKHGKYAQAQPTASALGVNEAGDEDIP